MNTRGDRSASVCICVFIGWYVSALMYTCEGVSYHTEQRHVQPHTHTHTHHEPTEPQAGLPLGVRAEGEPPGPSITSPTSRPPHCGSWAGWHGHTSLGSPWAPLGPSLTSTENLLPHLVWQQPRSGCSLLPTAGCGCVPGPAYPVPVGPLPAQQAGIWDLETEAAGTSELKGGEVCIRHEVQGGTRCHARREAAPAVSLTVGPSYEWASAYPMSPVPHCGEGMWGSSWP